VKAIKVGKLIYIHTDERDRLAIFKYANKQWDVFPEGKGDEQLRNSFLFASGAVGEDLAKDVVLDPANEFKPFPLMKERAAVLAEREKMTKGYTFKPLILDIGGEGRYFPQGVISVNIKSERYYTPVMKGSDAPDNGIPLLILADAQKLSKKKGGPFLPRSVDKIYIESSGFVTDRKVISGMLEILKPGGTINSFERDIERPLRAMTLFKRIKEINPNAAIIYGPKKEILPLTTEKQKIEGFRVIIKVP
jgi:hypothetical protein